MNQRILTINCLNIILDLQHLLLFETKDKKENNDLVNVIKSKLLDLKYEIEKMSEDEKEIEKPNEILDIVEKILEFSEKIQSVRGLKY